MHPMRTPLKTEFGLPNAAAAAAACNERPGIMAEAAMMAARPRNSRLVWMLPVPMGAGVFMVGRKRYGEAASVEGIRAAWHNVSIGMLQRQIRYAICFECVKRGIDPREVIDDPPLN